MFCIRVESSMSGQSPHKSVTLKIQNLTNGYFSIEINIRKRKKLLLGPNNPHRKLMVPTIS